MRIPPVFVYTLVPCGGKAEAAVEFTDRSASDVDGEPSGDAPCVERGAPPLGARYGG